MSEPTVPRDELPSDPVHIDLPLRLPASCLCALEAGHEAQSQSEKWSIYYRAPWLQIWRGVAPTGSYWAAVRFSDPEDGFAHVVECYAAMCALKSMPLDSFKELVQVPLFLLSGYDPARFGYRLVSGRRESGAIHFEGRVSTNEDLDEVIRQLRDQLAKLSRDHSPPTASTAS